MKKTLLLLLGTGAYNIYHDEHERFDSVFEVAGSCVGGFNKELNRLFGADDDVSVFYETDAWKYILNKYKQKGVENIIVLNCLAGSSSKNLEYILQASKSLELVFFLSAVVPFTCEGDSRYDKALQVVSDLVEESVSKINLSFNDDMNKMFETELVADVFRKFHKQVCDEILEMNCEVV